MIIVYSVEGKCSSDIFILWTYLVTFCVHLNVCKLVAQHTTETYTAAAFTVRDAS